jgi:CBS domain-containing protein
MRERHVSYLVVVEPILRNDSDPVGKWGERPVGVLTDRDLIVTVLAGDADPRLSSARYARRPRSARTRASYVVYGRVSRP